MNPIDLLTSAILPGTNLIEASAGTGKTQTIAGLFVRLLLETEVESAPLQVDQILVLTFTDAATEELRERIRNGLVRTLRAFDGGSIDGDDSFLTGLVERHEGRREQVVERLRLSIRCFDLAPIFTIHGFCQRALKDRAFESGSLFDEELLPDQSALMREVADDFWRRNFYAAPPLLLALADEQNWSPQKLLPLLKVGLSHPRLRVLSRTKESPKEIAARLTATFEQARSMWANDQKTFRSCFGSIRKWGNNPYNDDRKMAPLMAGLERLFTQQEILPRDLAALRKFSTSEISAGVTKRRQKEAEKPPSHPFFELAENISRGAEDLVVAWQRTFLEEARPALTARKHEQKLLSYDDLLTRLHDALEGPGGDDLARELRGRYRAALIDEFQDTDPVQARIFQRIFQTSARVDTSSNRPEHPLFLIGDPKQAIYGFRGADIFSYLAVARQAPHRFTLGENWRSDSTLVRAVNTFFGEAECPFVFPEIGFEKVTPRGHADETPLHTDGDREAPLQIWFCPRDEGTGEIQRKQSQESLPRAVAAEIARLLSGHHQIGTEALRPENIAVLVMTHNEAAGIQEALTNLHIPSVQQTQESVFASDDAVELQRVLAAIANPSYEPGVRAALSTRLSGVSGESLFQLQNDDAAWQRRLDQYRGYLEEWSVRGFAAMFRRWASEANLRPRLVAMPGGERSLTNTLHLAELLHQTSVAEKLGPGALVKWLAARVGGSDAATEEYQLRLERDENAVQIVTVHKSKGLQYDIVFVPFCWRESEPSRTSRQNESAGVLFHHWETGELTWDLGPQIDEAHHRQATAERLAENVRLLYVALTRARHRCYLAWGAFKGAGTSAPAWILHQKRGVTRAPVVPGGASAWSLPLVDIADPDLRADLEARARESAGAGEVPAIAVIDLPQEAGESYRTVDETDPALEVQPFSRKIDDTWRIASFSWMASGHRTEAPDHDPDELSPKTKSSPAGGIFAFPRGSKAGTCLHKIFESIELTERESAKWETVIRRQLAAHGIEDSHVPGVATAIRQTLAAPLGAGPSALRLNEVPKASRLTELEFCFALNPIEPAALRRLFTTSTRPDWAAAWPEQMGRLTFSPTRGYLKGFIDLVCEHHGRYYLIDWKSNWLGNAVADYDTAAIRREMSARFYVLQYHLYAIALHRHLQLRLPGYRYEQHFGGVHYLFVRGIDSATPGHGIFSEIPAPDRLEHLTATLLAAPTTAEAPLGR